MIRQAISCDICGAEKKQTNHWFVANEQGGELRISGWNARTRLRAGTRHLCGHTCLHKLVDEFMARAIDCRIAPAAAAAGQPREPRVTTDLSLASNTVHVAPTIEARTTSSVSAAMRRTAVPHTAVILPIEPVPLAEPPLALTVPPIDEVPNYASRRWRAEAWERARHSVEQRAGSARHAR